MYPFSVAKRLLARCGIHIYRTATLPRNVDVFTDLRRMEIRPEVIFDVGANIGQFTGAAVEAFPAATIYAFEPISEPFQKLKHATERHKGCHAHQLAFGSDSGTATVHLRANSVWNSLSSYNNDQRHSSGRAETVSVGTIDSFCTQNQIQEIDLLKTDTEGYDAQVLAGANQMLREARIHAIYSEVTFLESDRTHTQFLQILELLRAYQFLFYGVYETAGDFETMHANALFLKKPARA